MKDTEETRAAYELFCDRIYNNTSYYYDPEIIENLINAGTSIYNPQKELERNAILRGIIQHAPNEETAIRLLRLIHSKDQTVIQKLDTKSSSLVHTATLFQRWKLLDFLLETVKLSIDASRPRGHTTLYHLIQPEHMNQEFAKPIITELLKRKANPFLINKEDGRCAFDFIVYEEHKEIIRNTSYTLPVSPIIKAPEKKKTPVVSTQQHNSIENFLNSMLTSTLAFLSPAEPTIPFKQGYTRLSQRDDDTEKTLPTKGMKLKTE